MLKNIEDLRKELHSHPELSGKEVQTAIRIKKFVEENNNTEIITGLGGNGLAVKYTFSDEGPVVMIRCELDALPIDEPNPFNHRSTTAGVSHKCGHDGHMAIVAGISSFINEQGFDRGSLILLFQPAEETGKGAAAILKDPKFETLQPDYVFALHNIPGEPLNSIITVQHLFSPAVQSIAIYLTGKKSHASEPENGINPALAIAEIINELSRLNVADVDKKDFALLTPVHITMGAKAYGISAGDGEIHYTLRTWTEDVMEVLISQIQDMLVAVTNKHSLQFTTKWFDYFPTTVNNTTCNELIIQAAEANGFTLYQKPHPFKFGEDFGWFSQHYKTAMFGIGAGVDSPALHHADYDFPDALLESGIRMFMEIGKRLLMRGSSGY